MSMTKEEAKKHIVTWFYSLEDYELPPLQVTQALQVAISALRPITREQVEKVWRGCPECKPRCGLCAHMFQWDKYGKPYVCESCMDFSNFESDQQFCEACGAPMTDKAVDMVVERLEVLHGDL